MVTPISNKVGLSPHNSLLKECSRVARREAHRLHFLSKVVKEQHRVLEVMLRQPYGTFIFLFFFIRRRDRINCLEYSLALLQPSMTCVCGILRCALSRRLCLGSVAYYQNPTSRYLANNDRRMGELEPWIDENFIRSVWFGMGEQVNVKMIRDKFSG